MKNPIAMTHKRILVLLTALFVVTTLTQANPVDLKTAREVALKFMNANTKAPLRGVQDLQLVKTYNIERGDAAFHVFNTPNGFVIVSADDRATPILGYSDEGRPFDIDNVPIQLQDYLQGLVKQIQYGIENHVLDETISQQWEMVTSSGKLNNDRDGNSVGPLITTQWGQTGVYGSMCPNGIVGCVGVAVAQVMNYWQYPPKGIGHIDYNGNEVFFSETTYHWDSLYVIPEALPTLMYHAAIGSWSRFLDGSTGSGLNLAQSGLVSFFDYDTLSYFADKNDYFNVQWISLIKANLDNSIPVLYRGDISNGGGHAWVCDGYDENDMFHMNWGWEGLDDGWFLLSALNAGGWSITGGGAVFDLVPMNSPLQARFEYAKNDVNGRQISFFDFSKDAPNDYYWDFGDGNTSTLINPIHLYDTTGLYSVSLTVNKDGLSDIYSFVIEVKDLMYFEEIKSNIDELDGSGITIDYDMDGLQDLLWMDYDGSVKILKNCDSISPLGFSFNYVAEFQGCNVGTGRVVDFQNTNTPSVLCESWCYFENNNGTIIRDSSFNPSFYGQTDFWDGDEWSCSDVIDYNNDGLFDVVIGSTLYKNIGSKLFLPIENYFPDGFNSQFWSWAGNSRSIQRVSSIDIDKDGDLDIFSHHGLYLNNGDGTFQYVNIPSGWVSDDFNNDGWPDVIDCALHISSGADLSFDTRDTVFMQPIGNASYITFPNAEKQYHAHADIDNDGYLDIFGSAVWPPDIIYSYKDSVLERKELDVTYWETKPLIWIDFNDDGSIDAINPLMILGNAKTYLYKNIHSNNMPPTAPTNLSVETFGNTAILHWDASTDDHTYSGSLTYNIAVGSVPDSCDIYSPLSNLETGKRYAVNKGNAGMGTLWRVNDLPNGTYYWRVQAIDQAFAASLFSEMGTFTISGNNLPPAMAPIAKDCYMNKPNTFTREEFLEQYYDRDKDSLQSIIITQLPIQGTLFLNGNAVVEGQIISGMDLGQLYYVTTISGDDKFKLKPFDGTDYADYETTISFHTTIFEPVWELDNVSGDVAWGDFNNDGQLDFAATWGLYKNENGNFTKILDTVPASEHVFWADINNDGLLDAVFSETVLLNLGNDSFVWQEALSNQDGELSDMADANNDNKVDYLITSMDENLTALYFNTGSGYAEDSTYRNIPAFRDGNLKFADYNNDGMADFAITGWTNDGRETNLYRNSRLDFDKVETVLPEWGTGSLDWGDYDNDGDLDLIVCGYDGNEYKTAVYNNNHGTMSFVSTITLPGIIRGQAKWMDYDNDGLLDILLVGYDGNTACYLYKNTGFLTFNQIPTDQIGITPLWFSNVAIADFDGDGYQDVFLSGSDQNREAHTYLVRNTYGAPTSTTNITPEVPSNLQSVVNGNMVRLTWNKGSDNTTPQAAIAYNVYIRNEDNGEYEVSPLSDLQTGFRKVADRGNCGSNNFMDINSLDAGTYYWSVQSIDNGLMSSAFALEQSFTVTCNLSVTEIYDTVQCAYYWNGDYYLNSSTATGQFTTAEGCDSTVIIHVQVLQDTCWNPIYVTESGAGLHNGDSWENAMGDLQKAIDLAAMHGSSIWVKQGTFKGDTIQENAFYVYNGVSIYGGFMGNESADFDINLRNPMSHPTILDGQNAHRVLNSDDDGVNVLHNIDGFVLQNGKSDWYPGALLGDYSMIKNCIIRYNECIKGATHGVIQGGIIVNSIITRNTMSRIGIRNSILLNCVLANNYNVYDAILSVMARNSIIMDYVNATWGEVPDVLNCAMVGAVVPEGNLVVSPDNDGDDLETNYVRFMDPENDDYHLSCGSACVNMGTTDVSGLDLPSVDLQGNPRVMDGVIDIGAYEFDLSGNKKNIVVSVSLAEGGCVCGGGDFFCGEVCTISAESNEGYFFVNWTEDGAFISKDSIYSFVVTDDRNLVANFWEDGIIDFADDIVKNICVEHWDTNGDGELSYREAVEVTSLDYVFFMNYAITSFDELQFFCNLSNLENEFPNCASLRSIKIPSTITLIGSYTFYYCSSLGTIELSRSVNDISDYAFAYCVGLSSMIVLGETPPSLGWGAFEGVDHSIPVYVPCGSLTAYQNAEGWNEFTNFIEMCPGVISVVADPLEGGSVTGGGEYFCGETCTLTASPYFGYHFVNWTENGEEVSTDAAYSFIVSGDRNLSANFAQIDYHWSVDVNQYPDNMSVVGIIQIEGVEQFTDSIEVGAFSGEECRGRERPVYSPMVDRYLLFMTLYGEEGDELTFRLYDHRIGEELDMVCTNHIDFVINGSVGTPFDPYVFVFEPVIIQTTTFIDGWNWWSSFVEQKDLDGLQMLKDGLGEHGNMIKSQSAFIQYNGNGWSGSLNAINNESTYFVLTDSTCTVDIAGTEAMPSAHPITINPGWTWIGYPCRMALPLSALFSNITPSNGDIVKTQNGFVQYRNGEWFGSVNTITPGTGLLYNSNGSQSLTLVYPDDTRAGELLENVTADNNHWVPDVHAYPYNMTFTAVVELDGEELRGERYELAAFANGECRGSARLAYVATLDRYMAFLTIAGDEAADLVLGLYDTETGLTCFGADDNMVYQTNAVVGNVETPFVAGFRSPTGTDEFWSGLKVFPNPADKGAVVSLATPESRQDVARVEIVNALGVVVEAKEVASLRSASVRAPEVSGVYVIRITIDGVGTHCRKLVVR